MELIENKVVGTFHVILSVQQGDSDAPVKYHVLIKDGQSGLSIEVSFVNLISEAEARDAVYGYISELQGLVDGGIKAKPFGRNIKQAFELAQSGSFDEESGFSGLTDLAKHLATTDLVVSPAASGIAMDILESRDVRWPHMLSLLPYHSNDSVVNSKDARARVREFLERGTQDRWIGGHIERAAQQCRAYAVCLIIIAKHKPANLDNCFSRPIDLHSIADSMTVLAKSKREDALLLRNGRFLGRPFTTKAANESTDSAIQELRGCSSLDGVKTSLAKLNRSLSFYDLEVKNADRTWTSYSDLVNFLPVLPDLQDTFALIHHFGVYPAAERLLQSKLYSTLNQPFPGEQEADAVNEGEYEPENGLTHRSFTGSLRNQLPSFAGVHAGLESLIASREENARQLMASWKEVAANQKTQPGLSFNVGSIQSPCQSFADPAFLSRETDSMLRQHSVKMNALLLEIAELKALKDSGKNVTTYRAKRIADFSSLICVNHLLLIEDQAEKKTKDKTETLKQTKAKPSEKRIIRSPFSAARAWLRIDDFEDAMFSEDEEKTLLGKVSDGASASFLLSYAFRLNLEHKLISQIEKDHLNLLLSLLPSEARTSLARLAGRCGVPGKQEDSGDNFLGMAIPDHTHVDEFTRHFKDCLQLIYTPEGYYAFDVAQSDKMKKEISVTEKTIGNRTHNIDGSIFQNDFDSIQNQASSRLLEMTGRIEQATFSYKLSILCQEIKLILSKQTIDSPDLPLPVQKKLQRIKEIIQSKCLGGDDETRASHGFHRYMEILKEVSKPPFRDRAFSDTRRSNEILTQMTVLIQDGEGSSHDLLFLAKLVQSMEIDSDESKETLRSILGRATSLGSEWTGEDLQTLFALMPKGIRNAVATDPDLHSAAREFRSQLSESGLPSSFISGVTAADDMAETNFYEQAYLKLKSQKPQPSDDSVLSVIIPKANLGDKMLVDFLRRYELLNEDSFRLISREIAGSIENRIIPLAWKDYIPQLIKSSRLLMNDANLMLAEECGHDLETLGASREDYVKILISSLITMKLGRYGQPADRLPAVRKLAKLAPDELLTCLIEHSSVLHAFGKAAIGALPQRLFTAKIVSKLVDSALDFSSTNARQRIAQALSLLLKQDLESLSDIRAYLKKNGSWSPGNDDETSEDESDTKTTTRFQTWRGLVAMLQSRGIDAVESYLSELAARDQLEKKRFERTFQLSTYTNGFFNELAQSNLATAMRLSGLLRDLVSHTPALETELSAEIRSIPARNGGFYKTLAVAMCYGVLFSLENCISQLKEREDFPGLFFEIELRSNFSALGNGSLSLDDFTAGVTTRKPRSTAEIAEDIEAASAEEQQFVLAALFPQNYAKYYENLGFVAPASGFQELLTLLRDMKRTPFELLMNWLPLDHQEELASMATNIFGQLNNELLNNQGSMQGGEELLGRIKALKKAAGLKQFRM